MRVTLRKTRSTIAMVLFGIALMGDLRAEGTTLTTPEGKYYIHTGTTGGSCSTIVDGEQRVGVECTDGSDTAKAYDDAGCSSSSGLGWCAREHAWVSPYSGSQLNCPSGDSYNLHSGVNGDNNCEGDGGSGAKHCGDAENTNFAGASCEGGCGNSQGSGCCCKEGTSGCGTGPSCDQQ